MSVGGSRVDEALHQLREAIESRRYLPGEPLRLDALSRELDMSVQPIREAIRNLESEGLVRRENNRGAVVAKMSMEEVIEITCQLAVVEPMAIALATARATPDDLELPRAIHNRTRELVERDAPSSEIVPLTVDFHRALYRGAGAGFLNDFVIRSWSAIRVQTPWMSSRDTHVVREHADLLDAMAARDVPRAAEIMRAHQREAVQLHLAQLQATGPSSERWAVLAEVVAQIDASLVPTVPGA